MALEGEPLPTSAWTPKVGGYGNSQKQPWGHRQELPYDGQCVGEALVEIGRLQKQRLIRTPLEGTTTRPGAHSTSEVKREQSRLGGM